MKYYITKSQYKILLESETSLQKYGAVLVGGLEHRAGDKPLSEQIVLLKSGLGGGVNVKGFHHYDSMDNVSELLKQNPNIPVYLFSEGCKHSRELSNDTNIDLYRLYIIEPYAPGRFTNSSVKDAVSNGVPPENVFVGPSAGRGAGIVEGASSSKAKSHWDALTTVASMTK